MKIGHKLILGLVGMTLLIAAIGYVSLRASQRTLERAIGENSTDFAEQVLININRKIQRRIENIEAHSTSDMLRSITAQSNARFGKLPDPNSYIEQVEHEWDNAGNEVMPVMVELNSNALSRRLQSLRGFYQSKYDCVVFPEIFVTNKFGANIAQTNKTTDYYQADEEWWQLARKDGLYVSDVEYDESSNTYSVSIAVRIEDGKGEFLGVIKAILNIQETINTINEAKATAGYKTTQLHLINKAEKIIYSTKDHDFSQDAYELLIPRFGRFGQAGHRSYIIGQTGSEKGLLFAHAHSSGYGDFKGLDWILVTEASTAEIFAPIVHLRNAMLLTGLVIMGLALVASAITYRSIAISIAELKKATVQIAAGNLDANLTINTKDEIGQLAGSFREMSQRLKKTIAELNDEIAEHKKTEEKLQANQRFLDSVFDNMQDGINVLDKELNIVKANAWLENERPDALPLAGKKCFAVFHYRNSPCPWCPSIHTIKTGKQHQAVVPVPGPENPKQWMQLTTFPLKDSDGNLTGVIEHVKDVTEQKKAEQALCRSEQRFREVAENAREWVWETDANGLYTYASPVVKEILGYSPDELVGKKYFYDLFHPDDREALKGAAFDVLAKRLTFQRFVNRNIHKDGQVVWLSTSGVPILDEQGNMVGYRGVDADITEQRKAEAILSERAEQIVHHHNTLLKLANMPEQDLDSLLRITTEQGAEVLGVERVSVWLFNKDRTKIVSRDLYIKSEKVHKSGDSLRAQDYPVYFKILESSRIIAANNARSDPRTCEFEDVYLKPKGITSMMDVPIRLHNQVVGTICHEHIGPAREWTSSEQDFAASAADMISLKLEATERRKAEQALETLNKELETTVQELSRSNRQLQDFVHVAAHDLKTPVRGIGTLADWIISDYGHKLDQHGREQIHLLKARVMRIDNLIDGILQFSKIVRTKQKERQVNLNTEIAQIISNMKVPDNIEIVVDSLPSLTCEREHILQVFQCLLSNAITFMDKPKGLIRVGCLEQGKSWKFYVTDNGPGIEQKHFERIFRIFQTLPKKGEPETAGIGLAIAKKLIELYGGRIWIESQPGTGSTFFFTFPKQQEENAYANVETHIAH
jgi:PAS domain S-box-containing protein